MASSRVLVFQHAPYCPLGSFGEFLTADGIDPRVVELHNGDSIPKLDAFDALIVLGGPMDVWEEKAHPFLKPEKAAIYEWVRALDRPMLGICLGHQLLADVLGGDVVRAKTPEAGISEITFNNTCGLHPLFEGFEKSKKAINFHGCEVARLPPGSVHLASTSDCPIAAFSAGSAAFGIQYHAEADRTLFHEWTSLAPGKALVQQLYGSDGVERVRDDVARTMPEIKNNAARIYHNFMTIAHNGSRK